MESIFWEDLKRVVVMIYVCIYHPDDQVAGHDCRDIEKLRRPLQVERPLDDIFWASAGLSILDSKDSISIELL
jgi:hypothetical protein